MEKIFLARCARAEYDRRSIWEPAPELPGGKAEGASEVLLRRLLADAGMDSGRYGSAAWNPLGDLIQPGDKVLIKPNWVYHENRGGHGMDCLVTHHSVIGAILKYAIASSPSQIVIGDAPVQGCDFQSLLESAGVNSLVQPFMSGPTAIAVKDFRATKRSAGTFYTKAVSLEKPASEYVEFDLAGASALEPITVPNAEFRVTMYDPEAMKRTHAPGRHRYLVARDVIDADVVINVPKLKTHKKAGITGVLKNAVGINGLKDYLPHHRKGSPETGGDCYEQSSKLKSFAENCSDARYRPDCQPWVATVLDGAALVSKRLHALSGGNRDLEGSWYGNDTIWRTVLDLQRILQFGGRDGLVASAPQRKLFHITDAIIAGEGEGPLYPLPVPLGVLTMSRHAAAAEWVHALLMGFDPQKIPLVRNALQVSGTDPSDISVFWDGERITCDQFAARTWRTFEPPSGWKGHCESEQAEVAEARVC